MTIARVLERLLVEGQVPSWFSDTDLVGPSGHALARLVSAMKGRLTSIDRAVLVRQCLRRFPPGAPVVVPRLTQDVADQFARVGVHQSLDGSLFAVPYLPRWVAAVGSHAVDLPQSGPEMPDRAAPGEPWLRSLLGEPTWKSSAQREAVWHALNAPPNSTVLVGLPTGAGKSLVGQCCAAFESGLTVLVVPTVALGIDQLAAVRELPCADDLEPMLYPGEDPEGTLSAVESRRCRLLITSPEAIVAGRLRGVLRRHAGDGFLQRLVIDEAHLIESWGADFRVEFQLLGSVLRDWRASSPSGVRALLLSATFAPSTPEVLREMFSGGASPWQQHIIQRLRPEIHYFAASRWASAEEQGDWVVEALLHLPRPAILYVTERAQAEAWGARISGLGFSRFRIFHGDTGSGERRAIMDAWRNDHLDLVVATSAFGMGVDKADVKAVMHACFPEGIDRFYQEVGRGGRDGEACISLLVPTRRDLRVALTMGPRLLRDPEKVNGRWQAMWHSRQATPNPNGDGTSAVRIRLDTQPEHSFGQQSFAENIRWNKRLLLMMERARLIRLEGLQWEQSAGDEWIELATVRPQVPTLGLAYRLAELLAEPRQSEIAAIRRSTDSLLRYFNQERAVCRELRGHYGDDTRRACGSCAFCRSGKERGVALVSLQFDEEAPLSLPSVQVVQAPALNDPTAYSALVQAIRQLLRSGRVRRFVVPGHHRLVLDALFEHAERGYERHYRIDDLDESIASTIEPEERVVVMHVQAIEERAVVLHRRGRSVAHWLLGGSLEATPGRWPFMYEHGARPYPGGDGLTHWLQDQHRSHPIPPSVH
jgi:ATP-dependent DNA helicase RecQ